MLGNTGRVYFFTDPDPTKLCQKDRIQIHNTDRYDDEIKSLPLTVELLEGVIHGPPVSELHQPWNNEQLSHLCKLCLTARQQQSINNLFSKRLGFNRESALASMQIRIQLFLSMRIWIRIQEAKPMWIQADPDPS